MRVKELIKELQTILKYEGNVEVRVYPYDGQMNPSKAQTAIAIKTMVTGWNADREEWNRVECKPYVLIDEGLPPFTEEDKMPQFPEGVRAYDEKFRRSVPKIKRPRKKSK